MPRETRKQKHHDDKIDEMFMIQCQKKRRQLHTAMTRGHSTQPLESWRQSLRKARWPLKTQDGKQIEKMGKST